MRNFYKTLWVGLIFLTGSLTYGQITLNGCDVVFGDQDFIFNNVGTDATGRNIYQTTPLPPADIQSCPLGFCELQISWSTANNRWELVADDGADATFFNGENLIQYNTSPSLPNPPDLSLGTWTDATPAGGCGTDGFDSLTGDVQSSIILGDQDPEVTLATRTFFYTEGDPATIANNTLTVVDANNHPITSASVSISGFFIGDELAVTTPGPYTISYNSVTAVLTLVGSGSPAQMQTALRSITYRNTGDDPANGNTQNTRFLNYTVTDSTNGSGTTGANFGISITAVNDDPTISGLPTDVSVLENTASNVDLSAVIFTDVDAGTNAVTLIITAAQGTLTASSSGGVTISGSGTTTLTLTGSDVNIDSYLNITSNVQYIGPAALIGDNASTLSIMANDGGNTGIGGGSNVALGTINIDIEMCSDPVPDAATLVNITSECEVVSLPSPTATSNCGRTVTVTNDATLPITTQGTTTVTWTYDDGNGNTSTQTQNIILDDVTAPVIICPTNITVDCTDGATVVNYAMPTATDNCSLASTTTLSGYTSLGSFNGSDYFIADASFTPESAYLDAVTNGYNLVTINNQQENDYLAGQLLIQGVGALIGYNDVDSEGNFVWQSGSPATYTNWSLGNPSNSFIAGSPPGEDYAIIATDGLWNDIPSNFSQQYLIEIPFGVPTQTAGLVSGSSFPVGTTTNTFTVTDAAGNLTTCSFDVIVEQDVLAPVPDATSLSDVTDECSVTSLTAPTATDDCVTTVTVTNDATLPISNQGTTVVTWTYDDGNGNTSTQTQNVIIDDVTAPIITCTSNITQVNDAGDCGAVVNYTTPIVSDNCVPNDGDILINGSFEMGDFTGWTVIDFRIPFINYSVTNSSNNSFFSPTTATDGMFFAVNGFDSNSGPDTSLLYQEVNIPVGIDNAQLSWDENIDFDLQTFCNNCSNRRYEAQILDTSNNVLEVLKIYVAQAGTIDNDNVFVSEIADLTSYAGQTIRIGFWQSTPDPSSGPGRFILDNVNLNISSNSNLSVIQTAGLASGSTFPVGTTTNTFSVTDAGGNTSTCSFDVIVTDSEAPLADATTLMDVTAECEVTTLTAPTATDNCATTVTVTNDATLPISTQGTTVVTWTYDDGNGNTSTQTQNVIIDDVTAPVVTCPSDVLITCSDSAVVNYVLPTVTDNCSLQAREIGADFTSLGNLNGKAYYISNTPVSSVDAFAAAATNGYNLVTINNLEENDFLYNQVSSLGGEILFGFNDVNSEGTFVWQNGSTSTYTNWNTFEPNNANEEDYTGFTTSGRWNDIQAQTLVRYLIEVESFSINQTAGLASGSTFPVGTTTNSFTITDRSGNTASCSFDVVIVADTTAPVADVATLTDVTAECEVTSLIAPTATDDCATTVTVTNDATLPISGEGTTTVVTWTYDDGNGNTSTQTQNVIIDDVTAPVADATTLMDITAECEVTSLTAPTATDNCAGIVTVTNDATLPISGEGTTTVVTWTYDDGNGNTSTQTQNVIIDDVTAPVADATALMDVTAQCEITSLVVPTATDNCAGIVTVTNNVTLPITVQGTTVVTWTYDDGNGNTSTQTQNVILDDVTFPVADAASLPDLVFNCEVASLTAPTATDNCVGVVTGTATFPITSTTVVSWQFDDGNGNVSSQDQLVIIEQRAIDAIANVTVCDSFTLAAITGDYLTGSQLYYTQSDGNGIAFAEADTINFSDFASYPVTIYAYDTDMSGCSAQTSFQLTITETPVINPIMDVTACDEYVLPVLSVGSYYSFPGGNGSLLNAGTVIDATQTLFVYAEDVSGNCTDQETFTVTILPLDDASFNYNTTVYCPSAINPTPTITGLAGGTFTSTAGLVINAATGSVDLDTSMRGTYIVTYTTNGDCPQSTTVSFTIEDNVAPTPGTTVLADVVAECEVTTLVAPTATDDCSAVVTVTNDAIFPITGEGTTTVVTWTYDDGNGNTSTQTQNVVIDDLTAPVADATILTDVTAECEVTSLAAPTATDNCANATVVVSNDAVFPITGEGTTTVVTWTYDDGNGNTSTQTQNVIIDDVTAPVADVATLTDVTAECEVTSLVAPTATDNCANATVLVSNDAIFPITGEGTTTVVTWTYDDGNGNTSTQTQNVIIDDVTAPVADLATLTDVTAECEVTSLAAPTATDNCANATVVVSNDAVFPISGEGTTTVVTWTYDDGNGNTSTQTQNVIIDDVTAPVADLATLTDVTAECEVTSLVAPTATDNCANATVVVSNDAIFPISGEGTTTVVTWTYDDGNGNTSTQTQNVIIDDVTAPVADVATLTDVTAECEVTSLVAPTATDNCANATVLVSNDAVFPITGEGTTTIVTWTYDDGNGNTSTQTQNVIIDDVTAPVADVATLTDVIAECEVTSLVAPIATDNCANATVLVSNDAIFPITGEGTTTVVTWTYDDGNGNTSTQTQNVIIDDLTAPIANLATLTDVTAECEVTSLAAPTATDNCANATVLVSNDAIFPITGEGTTTIVTWTYDDGNGNTSTQIQNVIIDDVTAPVANVATLADVVAECEVTSLVAPTATDNCANATVLVSNDAIFPISGEGTTTVVTWTYDDGNGNTSTQTQNVIIDDVTAPVADVAALPTLNFNCEVTVLTAPTSTDNCAGTITATNTVIFPLTSSTLVNWSYDDGNGNVSSQDQLVVVELRAMDAISDVTVCDTYTLPNISGDFLTGSQMYYTQSGGNGIAFAEADVLNYLDFAVYPVTLYAYDVDAATGCSAETSFLLTINESPVLSPIADVTICEKYILPVLSVGDYYTFPGGNGTLMNPGTVIDATQTIFVYAEDASGSCTDETSFIVNITPSDVLGATFNDASFTYDGTTHSIAVENIPATATVVYTNNDQVDAGTYTVTATVTSATSSCNSVVLTATMVIDRAPQTITFDSLTRRRLNVDPDFQLMASSTSGLPIAYNYSFTGATAAATVSNTGFVNLLAEGEILISASQAGNSNYLPATAVQQVLEVYLGDNADLDSISIDGNITNNPASEVYYLIDCGTGTDSVEVNLSNSDGATFTPGATFSIATPRPGIYTQEVTVTADNGRNTRSYIITVERRFEFDEIVEQKYNNTLVVNNNFDNNGGYNFVSYEWFKNGRLVSTEQFFSEGDNASDLLDPTASYYVRMTTDAGEVLQTCISSVSLGNTFSLTVLENPVIQGRLLQVRADYPAAELDHAMYQIYSAHGQFIKAVSVQGLESQIRLSESLPVGLYRLVLITSQRTESVNFIKN
ncbi:HYR domain-containing protein [Nonlabens sp. Asnod2-A12]|uniref:HYR domain-containing protein n=1 Tax=Nonlabens sp. Asnod2-A12 TaxID=3160578 RepID=UPI00387013A0